MTHEQEILARAMSHIDDDMILAAHAPRKKVRRTVPYLVAACLAVTVAVSFPYLREIIDTDSDLFNPENEEINDAGENIPTAYPSTAQDIPVTLGGTTLTLTDTTRSTATFTVVKTDDTPLYIMLYDRRDNTLATTEPNYKAGGVTIRPNRIRLYVNGAEQPVYHLPTAPGTYEVVVDFSSVRDGTYPMREYVGFYAYVGENKEAVTERFSLEVVAETDTAETVVEGTDTTEPDTAEAMLSESETISE